jgi:hypothetical protein
VVWNRSPNNGVVSLPEFGCEGDWGSDDHSLQDSNPLQQGSLGRSHCVSRTRSAGLSRVELDERQQCAVEFERVLDVGSQKCRSDQKDGR